LGLHHATGVARAIGAFAELATFYDPRRWPEHQHWIITVQNDLDESLALICDSQAGWAGRAA